MPSNAMLTVWRATRVETRREGREKGGEGEVAARLGRRAAEEEKNGGQSKVEGGGIYR